MPNSGEGNNGKLLDPPALSESKEVCPNIVALAKPLTLSPSVAGWIMGGRGGALASMESSSKRADITEDKMLVVVTSPNNATSRQAEDAEDVEDVAQAEEAASRSRNNSRQTEYAEDAEDVAASRRSSKQKMRHTKGGR